MTFFEAFQSGPEVATRSVLSKKQFLKILQYSHESTCIGVPFNPF